MARHRTSLAGHPEQTGRARRIRPMPGPDRRDCPIPGPPGPAPAGPEPGTWMVWSPWSGEWQVFAAVCPDCSAVAPIVFPERVCGPCARRVRQGDRDAAYRVAQVVADRLRGPAAGV